MAAPDAIGGEAVLRRIEDYCTRRANQMSRISESLREKGETEGAEQAKAADVAYGQVLIELARIRSAEEPPGEER